MPICRTYPYQIPVQEMFFMRHLWVNVFCIHDLKTGKSKMYLYHKGEGNKSPHVVCSCLLDYINKEVSASVRKLVLFSDGPSGQNKKKEEEKKKNIRSSDF